MPRTRTTKTTPAAGGPATTKPKPARTRQPRKTTAARTPLSLVKQQDTAPAARPTLVDLRHPLPVRRRLFVGPMGPNEQAAIRAALAAAATRIPVPVRTWNGSTANLTDGTILTHNPSPDRIFTAHIACQHGAIHGYPITSHTDLREARALTHACQRRHTANTTNDDGIDLDWNKAVARGVQPTSRLGEGLKTAKKAAADTQSLSLQDIADGITARAAADSDAPKEHPQP